MRAWRALKAAGAAVLRDGVYALPAGDDHRRTLDAVAADVRASGGQARVLAGAQCDDDPRALFDRSEAFQAWLRDANDAHRILQSGQRGEVQRVVQRLRRSLDQLMAIDFFPGQPQHQAREALQSLDGALLRALAPDEPHAVHRAVPRQDARRYRGRTWATRQRPWVDRLASVWLIRRFIDPQARFVWLATPADCPRRAVGFDFDGATFTHVGARVTFETLLAAFDLETPALLRLGTLVHALDAGGVQPPETTGVERVLAGMREAIADDDQLAQAAAGVFEGLYVAFAKDAPP